MLFSRILLRSMKNISDGQQEIRLADLLLIIIKTIFASENGYDLSLKV